MPPSRRTLLVTPCKDEAAHLEATLRTVAAQSLPPTKWIIVDDGSTDRTPEILAEAAARLPFLDVVTRHAHKARAVGGGVIEAFQQGLEGVDPAEYDYLCKLDADLELPPRYFETIVERMEAEPRLGNLSGKVYQRLDDGRLVCERMGDENAIGAAKFYRVACFEEIGGFVAHVGWDGIDGHMCRLKGWIARSVDEPELRIVHRRQMGSSHRSLWHGRQRWGRGKWYMGSAFHYVAAVAVYRAAERPYLVGGLGILTGYVRAMLSGSPRFAHPGFRRSLRRFERLSLTRGKAAAIRELSPTTERSQLP